jgi:cell division septum initiation protein DivIVA
VFHALEMSTGLNAFPQEEENLTLAANNAQLQQRIAELEAALMSRTAAEGSSDVGAAVASASPSSGREAAAGLHGISAGVPQAQHEVSQQAERALLQAAAARRLSGACMVSAMQT